MKFSVRQHLNEIQNNFEKSVKIWTTWFNQENSKIFLRLIYSCG